MQQGETNDDLSFEDFKRIVLNDYRIAFESRQASLLGRKEVLTGKAKFGIFGDGKELAQIAMAKVFKNGDLRAGYYRDQTFMFATGMSNVREFFAQLYAHTDIDAEPASAGRSMNGHFGTRFLNPDGSWKDLTQGPQSSSDISPTGGQMGRLLGLAYASKLYRNNPDLSYLTNFSRNGNEIAFGTIGNASTSEGPFWEAINAAGVLQVPMLVCVWDDDYGISVQAKYQTTKQNISEILKGFARDQNGEGYNIYTVRGWDYAELCEVFVKAADETRKNHIPAIIHVREMTQPQGHSTSGSHERYKTKERLAWEQEYDCLRKMREWIMDSEIASEILLDELEQNAKQSVLDAKKAAWENYLTPIKADVLDAAGIIEMVAAEVSNNKVAEVAADLRRINEPNRKDIGVALNKVLRLTNGHISPGLDSLQRFKLKFYQDNEIRYSSNLYNNSALDVTEIKPQFSSSSKSVDGYQIMQACFDAALSRNPAVFAIGEDVGKIGDVNQGFAGLQEKFGEIRVGDTGIREHTIIGQGIGAAMRGLRPIVEIQYLDYLLFALQIMSDDLATLQWRTRGGQKAPLIIRTRGHRLEGIWHSGSPMGMIINAVRGMYVLTPRNMVQAAGFYNTLLMADEPALVIECLNGYRIKETLPDNIGEYTLPIGIPETIRGGNDVTLVTYGSCCRIAIEAAEQLSEIGIDVEIIDAQSLLPFDINHHTVKSIMKTNKLVVLDEDVPGGASAYLLQKLLEEQEAYKYLDSKPITISSKPHRPAYGTDGDYFSKPSAEQVYDVILDMMKEYHPEKFSN